MKLAFANPGRPNRKAAAEGFDRIRDVARQVLGRRAWIALVEIDEADNPATDHRLVRATWPRPWRMLFRTHREVVMVPALARARAGAPVFGCEPLEHQTPERWWLPVRRRRVTLIVGHPPAGATGHNGDGSARRADVRDALAERYDRMMAALRDLVDAELRAGRDVVLAADFNDPRGLTGPLAAHGRHVEITQSGPDGIYAIPRPGRVAVVRHAEVVRLGIEAAHNIHLADVVFRDADTTTKEHHR